MVAGSVGPYQKLHRGIRVQLCDSFKTGILTLLAHPVQKRQIHHAVNNHPADVIVPVPGTDKIPQRVEPCRQHIGRILSAFTGFGISGQAVIRNGGMKPHKSHVMIQPPDVCKGCVHFCLHPFRGQTVFLFSRSMVHLPHHTGPEAIGPPEHILLGIILFIAAVYRDIRDTIPYPAAFRTHFNADFTVDLLQPFLFFFLQFFSLFHGKLLFYV